MVKLERTPTIVAALLLGLTLGLRKLPGVDALPIILAFVLLYGFGAVINDLADAKFDSDGNPITLGKVSKKEALLLAIALAFSGILLCSLYGSFAVLIGILELAAGFVYSYLLEIKSRPFNTIFLMSTHTTIPLLLGYQISAGRIDGIAILFALSLATWLSGMIVIKDFKDFSRDLSEKRSNPVILLGRKNAAKVVLASAVVMVLSSLLLLQFFFKFDAKSSLLFLGMAALFALALKLYLDPSEENGGHVLRIFRHAVVYTMFAWMIVIVK